ncbi:MAG TPA: hypothetical protein VM261_00825, partial [Kofleriaceae bacterium]|nr:hypothetical protein [Kofleriaceae bacterium]
MRRSLLAAALFLLPAIAHAQPAPRAEIATLRTDVDALRAKVAELDATGGSEARRLLTLVEALATRVEALD